MHKLKAGGNTESAYLLALDYVNAAIFCKGDGHGCMPKQKDIVESGYPFKHISTGVSVVKSLCFWFFL